MSDRAYETHYSPDRQQRLVIEYDGDPMNPRTDWDNHVTSMWCEHSRYNLGDADAITVLRNAIEKLAQQQGVNLEDEYIECPACGGASSTYDNAIEDYPTDPMARVDVFIHLPDDPEFKEEMEDVRAGSINRDVIHGWCPRCDECGMEGAVENDDYNELDSPSEIRRALERVDPDEGHVFILPLYLYDHSGITMNTTGFSCGWDTSHVGLIFITREKVIEEGMWGAAADMPVEELRKLGHKTMRGDVETYDQYLRGDVYGFRLEKLMPKPDDWDAEEWAEVDEHWEETDSCWGFYGDDVKENGALDHTGISAEEFAEWRAA